MRKVLHLLSLFLVILLISSLLFGCQEKVFTTKDIPNETKEQEDNASSWQEKLQDELLTLTNYEAPDTSSRPDGNGRSWYQVFVWSFYDSNSDGVGDLRGITEQLEYIKALGLDGIWISPIHPSDTYHKYDVKDYYSVDSTYGTMDDFEELVNACHEKGLKLIIDMVLNHTSIDNPWFKEHPEYYHIEEEQGNGGWKRLPDGRYYECQFWDRMPDLNLEQPELREEFKKIFTFWFDKGVDGFRLDAVKEYESGNTEKNIEILRWVNDTVKEINPNAYLVGENWDTTNSLYRYYESGLDSLFAFSFAGSSSPIAKTLLQNTDINDYLEKLISAEESVKEYNKKATMASFFTNHDNPRAAGFLKRDPNLIKTAWGMSLMHPGDAFLYYGEELGMSGSGKDENKRAPMYWTDEKNSEGMTKGPPGMESMSHSFPPAIDQVNDPNSIFTYIRKAILLRVKYPEIARGDISLSEIELKGDNIGAVERKLEDSTITVVYNASEEDALVSTSKQLLDFISATGKEPNQSNNEIIVPGYTILILEG